MSTPSNDDKLWGGLSYVGLMCCMIGTLVIFFLKKDESAYIKFHSLQALAFGLASFVISVIVNIAATILGQVPLINIAVGLVVFALFPLAILGIWIFLMIQAFTGKDVRIPVIADFIDQNLMG